MWLCLLYLALLIMFGFFWLVNYVGEHLNGTIATMLALGLPAIGAIWCLWKKFRE